MPVKGKDAYLWKCGARLRETRGAPCGLRPWDHAINARPMWESPTGEKVTLPVHGFVATRAE